MKALSVKQPWAHWLIYGRDGVVKEIETRTWATDYRGDLLIAASRTAEVNMADHIDGTMDFGQAIGVVEMVDCRPMARDDVVRAMCPCLPGVFSWCFVRPRPVRPFFVRGRLGLYEVDDRLIVFE